MSLSAKSVPDESQSIEPSQFTAGAKRRRWQESRFLDPVTVNAGGDLSAETAAPVESPALADVPPGRRVLVVDDNRDLAESLAMILRFWGHDVTVAFNGRDALELARSCQPDVVFLDIGLPRLDGFEVARAMRADPDLQGTRIVAVTGYGRDEDRQRCRDAGFDLHLTKPVDPWRLQALLADDC